MGYYVNGSVRIEASPENLTSAALLFDSIANRYHRLNDIRDDFNTASGGFVSRALIASGFSDPTEEALEGGGVVVSAYYDEKWWDSSDFIHFLAAESGMSIQGEFRGEDGMGWAWYAKEGRALEDVLHSVQGRELERLKASASLVESARALISERSGIDAGDLLDRLHNLLLDESAISVS